MKEIFEGNRCEEGITGIGESFGIYPHLRTLTPRISTGCIETHCEIKRNETRKETDTEWTGTEEKKKAIHLLT